MKVFEDRPNIVFAHTQNLSLFAYTTALRLRRIIDRATLSEVVRKAVQSQAIRTLPELADDCPINDKTPQNKAFCGVVMPSDEACEMALMGGEGLKQPSLSGLKTVFSVHSNAESNAVQSSSPLVAGLTQALATDADLRRLAAIWGRLSPADRQALARHAETLAAGRVVGGT